MRPDGSPPQLIASTEEVHAICNHGDALVVCIRGHLLVERGLNFLLMHALHAPHAIEVRRLPFSIKLDLVVALGLLPATTRTLGRALNAVRNKLAHGSASTVDLDDARKLTNAMGSIQRAMLKSFSADMPAEAAREILSRTVAILFVEVDSAFERSLERALVEEVMAERVDAALTRSHAVALTPQAQADMEFRELVAAKRRERGW